MDKRPDVSDMHPEQITTVAQLATALRTVLARSGLSIREAARTAQSTSKVAASKSTFAEMLKGERLPAKGSMVALLSACGLTADQIRPWQRAWERLSDSFVGPVDDRAPAPSQGSLAPSSLVVQQPDTVRPQVSVPGARYRPLSRAVTLSAFVLVGLTALGGAIALIARGDDLSGSSREGSEPVTAKSQVQASSLGGCRGAIPLAHAPVVGNPCISVIAGQVEVASRIVALQPGKVTVFVWLTDGNIYRPNVQPHRCTFDFAAAGDTQTCSTRVQPDRPGTHWVAATEAKEGWAASLPDGWDSFPYMTGTQSGHPLTWPLQK